MTRRRWIADEVEGDRAALVGRHAAHLARVLRAEVGQEFDVATGDAVRRARVASVDDERVEFDLGDIISARIEAPITLLLAVFKFDRFEWAIEKCTELGVSRIVPVLARRTDIHLAKTAIKRAERWRKIAREASEQSRRVSVPGVAEPVRLKQALLFEADVRCVLSETETFTSLGDVLDGASEHASIALAVGPEGGWSEEELEAFAASGWTSVSLGERILRAETAAMVGVAAARMGH